METHDRPLDRILRLFSPPEELHDLLAASQDWSGYKREDAVRRLGRLGSPAAIPQLLERANDWVPQVRKAAEEALSRLLHRENAAAFVMSLPALYHLQSCGRWSHDDLITRVVQFLINPENSAHLRHAAANDDPHVARIAAKLCLQHSLIEPQELVATCLPHRDVVVRNMAANLIRELPDYAQEPFIEQAMRDAFMPIRREALLLRLRKHPEQMQDIAGRMLFDRHHSIREIAIRRLLEGGVDVAGILNDVLAKPGQPVLKVKSAVLGLAEIGAKDSVPQIAALFASDATPGVRKACLQSLARLLGEGSGPYVREGLKDVSPGVAKESCRLMHKMGIKASVDELLYLVEATRLPHGLAICLSLARDMDKWDALIVLLNLMKPTMLSEKAQAELMREELHFWDSSFNRRTGRPTAAQIERIAHDYRLCEGLFRPFRDDWLHRSLVFTLKTNGIVT